MSKNTFVTKPHDPLQALNARLGQFSGRPVTKEIVEHDYYMAQKMKEFDAQNPQFS